MTSAHVFIATSLDGYIARKDGDISWLIARDDPSEDHGYSAFIHNIDAIVMGRGSYEKVLGFDDWPYELPVIVMTSTLTDVDTPTSLADKVTLTSKAPKDVLDDVANRGFERVYLDGGKLIQSFLRDGLVSDLVITTVPVLIGTGLSLFGEVAADIDLVLTDIHSFPSGLVQARYAVKHAE